MRDFDYSSTQDDCSTRPLFIAIEGVDGAGKTTIGEMLSKRLGAVFTELNQQEFKTFIHANRRDLDHNAFHLVNLASLKQTSSLVEDALEHGHPVVCGRYKDSVMAYHEEVCRHHGKKDAIDQGTESLDIIEPDLTVFLTVSDAEHHKRMGKRAYLSDADHMMSDMILRSRITRQFRRRADIEIDTSNQTPEETLEMLMGHIQAKYPDLTTEQGLAA